ncbi:MAG TPA: transposase, partial [Bryobacteraceae bacterium]|nr:transposase [Bryobacteraceae bacterium]
SRIAPMKKIARTLRAHRELLLNYFKARKQISSGVVEGLKRHERAPWPASLMGRCAIPPERTGTFRATVRNPSPQVPQDCPLAQSAGARPSLRYAD